MTGHDDLREHAFTALSRAAMRLVDARYAMTDQVTLADLSTAVADRRVAFAVAAGLNLDALDALDASGFQPLPDTTD